MQIEKLSVSEPGQQTPFARVEELRVGLGWWPLLFGNREVRSVALYGPSANISRDQEGRLSIADLFQRHSQSSFSIKLDTLKIREGTLVLSDQMTRTDSRVASISLDADNLLGRQPQRRGHSGTGFAPGALGGQHPLSIQDDQVSLEELDAVAMTQVPGLGESKLTISGQYKLNFATLQATGSNVALAFSSERPSSEVHLTLPQINASFDEFTMPSGQLSAKLSYARSQYQLEATLENLKLNEAGLYADKLHGDFNWLAGSTKVNVKLNAPLSLAGMNQLRMQPLALTSSITTPLLPRGKLVSTMDGALDGDLDEPRFNLRVAGKMDGSDLAVTVSQYGLIKPRHEATVSVGRLGT